MEPLVTEQGALLWTDFRHKGVVAAGVGRLERVLGREVGRMGVARHVGVARESTAMPYPMSLPLLPPR